MVPILVPIFGGQFGEPPLKEILEWGKKTMVFRVRSSHENQSFVESHDIPLSPD